MNFHGTQTFMKVRRQIVVLFQKFQNHKFSFSRDKCPGSHRSHAIKCSKSQFRCKDSLTRGRNHFKIECFLLVQDN